MFKISEIPEQNPYLGKIKVHLPDSVWVEITDKASWHHNFYDEVYIQIDETIFSPLYDLAIGRSNIAVRLLVSMMILKAGRNWTDAQMFEAIRFNLLVMSALGLGLEDSKPSERVYYYFKAKLELYEAEHDIDLLQACFRDLGQKKANKYGVSGKKSRMDGKQFSSNTAKCNRLEFVISVLQKFYGSLDAAQRAQLSVIDKVFLETLAKKTPSNHSFGLTKAQRTEQVEELGDLLFRLIESFGADVIWEELSLLQRLFEEQYSKLVEDGKIVLKKKAEISGQTLQSAHDTEARYIKKGKGSSQQTDIGYAANITETIDLPAIPGQPVLNIITDATVFGRGGSEKKSMLPAIEQTEKMTGQTLEEVYTDGNYHSPDNLQGLDQLNEQTQRKEDIEWHISAIQGKASAYDFEWLDEEQQQLQVTPKSTGIPQIAKLTASEKYRIKIGEKEYRYFEIKQINNYFIRKKIEAQPPEVRKRRANVEATVGHVFATLNGRKTKYRGLHRNQCFVTNRVIWVNYRRVVLFKERMKQFEQENQENEAA